MINITADEAKKLLGAIPPRSPFGGRDRAIILFLLHTGLRVSELVALNIGHVRGFNGQPRQQIIVRGKGGQVRSVPLNKTAQQAILDLVEFNNARGFSTEPTAPLLVNRKHKRLRTRAVQYMFAKWREKADLGSHITPHSARHAFATAMTENATNTRVVQEILGHRRLASTQIYTRPSFEAKQAAVLKLDS